VIKLTKAEQRVWNRPTVETSEERDWIDRLAVVRPDMFPLKFFDRNANGSLDWPTRLFVHDRRDGAFGCYPINMEWIKAEVLKLEAEAREESQREIERSVGAFI